MDTNNQLHGAATQRSLQVATGFGGITYGKEFANTQGRAHYLVLHRLAEKLIPLDSEYLGLPQFSFTILTAGTYMKDLTTGVGRCSYARSRDCTHCVITLGLNAFLDKSDHAFREILSTLILEAAKKLDGHATKKVPGFTPGSFVGAWEAILTEYRSLPSPLEMPADVPQYEPAPRPPVVRLVRIVTPSTRLLADPAFPPHQTIVTDELDWLEEARRRATDNQLGVWVFPVQAAKDLVHPALHDQGPSFCLAEKISAYIAWPGNNQSKGGLKTVKGQLNQWRHFFVLFEDAFDAVPCLGEVVVPLNLFEELPVLQSEPSLRAFLSHLQQAEATGSVIVEPSSVRQA